MSMRRFCAHLTGFAIFLVAALLALPQAAQAHVGHAHAMQVQIADAFEQADHAADRQVEQSLTAASPGAPDHPHGVLCERSCCAQASCVACFGLVAPNLPLMQPPSGGSAIAFASNRAPPGIGRPSLRRPPRSFA